MAQKKLKVGDRVSWVSYGKTYRGKVEKILPPNEARERPVKVRPNPGFKGEKVYLTSFKEKNLSKQGSR